MHAGWYESGRDGNAATEKCAAAGKNAVRQGVGIRRERIAGDGNFPNCWRSRPCKARWEKVRKYFFLRESTYDMSNRCNLRCDGCYYYEGEKQFARENGDPEAWRTLMRAEKARGITYVVLAGAEPSLVPGTSGGLFRRDAAGLHRHQRRPPHRSRRRLQDPHLRLGE